MSAELETLQKNRGRETDSSNEDLILMNASSEFKKKLFKRFPHKKKEDGTAVISSQDVAILLTQ